VEIRRDNRKVTNIKRNRLFKNYNIKKTEELDQLIEELKQKVSATTQIQEVQTQFYQNEIFRTDCKNFYNRLRQTFPSVNNAPGKDEVENFWREIYGKKFNITERRAG
jgi:adenosine deaminase